MNAKKKAFKNIALGIVSQALTVVLGIIIPRLVLTNYGSEINGLINSITQIYAYFALIEAGIGTATIQALYKTIGEDNKNGTNAVLSATNRFYRRTGLVYLIFIILFSIIYPFVVKTDIPKVTIILVIVFNGIGSVISYFYQGKYTLLLQAEGKQYVNTAFSMVAGVFRNLAKIVLIQLGLNIVSVQAISMIISLSHMAFISWYIKKYYSWIDVKVPPNFESISQSKNVVIHKVSALIFGNTDSIILSVFCGLKTVSVYSMYALLFGMVTTLQTSLTGSLSFVLGQTYHTDRNRFEKLYECYELYSVTIVFALSSITNFFILPFLKLYTKGVTDITYIDSILPYLFVATQILSYGRGPSVEVINIAGHFKQTQSRAILEAFINIIVSVIAVHLLGIYGVLIGTIVALLYRTNDMIIYANKYIMHRSCWKTYKRWTVNIVAFIFMDILINRLNIDLSSYVKIILCLFPYSLCTLFVFFFFSFLTDLETFRTVKEVAVEVKDSRKKYKDV